jgi:hypothetical protein
LKQCGKKAAMCFTVIRMAGQPLSQTMQGEILARPLVREILREIDLTPDEFVEKLQGR